MKRMTCPINGRVCMWLMLILLTLGAVAGFIFLSVKIPSWEKQLVAGQRNLNKGHKQVEKGKQRLKDGKRELSEGKAQYAEEEDSVFSEFFDDLLDDGEGFAAAREEISEGEKQVARGQKRMTAGKRRLTAGQQRFDRESRHLALARGARIFCAVLAAFLVALSIFLLFRK